MSRVQRLRPEMTSRQLSQVYAVPHDFRHWDDHILRIQYSKRVGDSLFITPPRTVADLSCGNGLLAKSFNAERTYLGDFAPGYEFQGPIEETIQQLPVQGVDLFILCETLEHLDDPQKVLSMIRVRTDALLLSTPLEAWDEMNPEHYWAWDREFVEEILENTGFDPTHCLFDVLDTRPMRPDFVYKFGIWGVR